MATFDRSSLADMLREHQAAILADWLRAQGASGTRIPEQQRDERSRQLLALLTDVAQRAPSAAVQDAVWAPVRDLLAALSRSRAHQGFSPFETATFVFSLKEPLFKRLQEDFKGQPEAVAQGLWQITAVIDRLGLYTTELHQKGRDEIIARQQEEMLELSTPVVQLWTGILALPVIGTLDSARTQVVMENLLEQIVRTGRQHRHHRHHRRAHGRHAGGAAPAEDRGGGAADGGRLHHLRHPAADRPDDRPSGRRTRPGHHESHAGGRVRDRLAPRRPGGDPRRAGADRLIGSDPWIVFRF
jgi:hypothetical protein